MGALSFLRFIPKSSAAAPIDWSKVPEKSKQYFQDYFKYVEPEITDEEYEDTASEEATASEEVTASEEITASEEVTAR